jgi:hypothetical protein
VTKTTSRKSGQLPKASRADEREKWTIKDRAANNNKSGQQTTTKVGSRQRWKWAADYAESGQQTSTIVGGRVRIEKGGEEAYYS